MAITDYLKTAGQYLVNRTINPLDALGTSDLLRPRTPTAIAPSALETNLAALQAKNAPARTALQSRYAASRASNGDPGFNRSLPGPSGDPGFYRNPTGQIGTGDPGFSRMDPATQQLQQEAANLAKYGSPTAPTAPTQLSPTPAPSLEDAPAQEGDVLPATPRFADTYRNIYDQLGLGDIRSQIEKTGTDLQDLQNKKVDEISLVNENPWLTEGQRQDRVNAIGKRYEQKESNLMNRIQLFQSTFEQGRQEAQFIASQTAQEQRANTEFLEKRFEAEQKLREKGQEVLSVADARALKVPYGTTISEARRLGVIPEEEKKYGAGIVGEFQFYEERELAAGRKPIGFNEYQDVDINRKRRLLAGAGVGGLLSDTQQSRVEAGIEAKAITAGNKLTTLLDNYRSLVDKYGFDAVGKGRAVLNSAYADLKIAYKEAANLGALTGPDVSIIEEAINPSAGIMKYPAYLAAGGKDGVLASIDQVKTNVVNNVIANQTTLKSKWGTYSNDPYIQQLATPPVAAAPEGSVVEKDGAQYRKNADGSLTRIK